MRRDLFSGAVGALVATAMASGIAWAAIPGAGGVIDGCYQRNEGQLRVIDPRAESCRHSEVPIAWNEQGTKGDRGEPGTPGRDGVGVTVEPEAAGANCPAGGARLTGASGVAYVCSALSPPPDPGAD